MPRPLPQGQQFSPEGGRGCVQGRRAVLGPGAHVSAWRQEGRAEAEAGRLGFPGPWGNRVTAGGLPRCYVAPGHRWRAWRRGVPGRRRGDEVPSRPGGRPTESKKSPERGLRSVAGSSLCPSLAQSVFQSVSHQSLPPRSGHAPPAQAWLLRVKGRPPARPRGDRAASWGRGRPGDPGTQGQGRGCRVGQRPFRASARPLPQAGPS